MTEHTLNVRRARTSQSFPDRNDLSIDILPGLQAGDSYGVFAMLCQPLFGGFLLQRDSPGEKAWFSPQRTPTVGSLTRCEPQPITPPGLTFSQQALLSACPAVGSENLDSLAVLCESPQGELPHRALSFPALNGGACRAPGQSVPDCPVLSSKVAMAWAAC